MRFERAAILALAAFVLMTSGLGRALHEAIEHSAAQTHAHSTDCAAPQGDQPRGESLPAPDTDEDCSDCDLLHAGAKALPGATLAGVLDARPTGMLAAGASARLVRFELAAHPARGPPATLLA